MERYKSFCSDSHHWAMLFWHIHIHQYSAAACNITGRQNNFTINTHIDFTDVCIQKSNAVEISDTNYVYISWRLIPRRRGFTGRSVVSSCALVGGCGGRFLMRTPYCTLDRRRFGMRMIQMLLALSSSCVFPLQLHASLPRTYNWLLSLMTASCLGLLLPRLMADSRLCRLSLQLIFVTLAWSTTITLAFLEFAKKKTALAQRLNPSVLVLLSRYWPEYQQLLGERRTDNYKRPARCETFCVGRAGDETNARISSSDSTAGTGRHSSTICGCLETATHGGIYTHWF